MLPCRDKADDTADPKFKESQLMVNCKRLFSLVVLASSLVDTEAGIFGRESFPTWTYDSPCKTMAWNHLPDLAIGITTVSRSGDSIYNENLGEHLNVSFVGVAATNATDDAAHEPIPGLDILMLDTPTTVVTVQTGTWDELPKARQAGKSIATKLKRESKDGPIRARLWLPLNQSALATEQDAGATEIARYIQELTTSLWLNLYHDQRFKGEMSTNHAIQLKIIVESSEEAEDNRQPVLQDAVDTSKKIAKGVYLARDIVQAPHNVLNSLSLAETASRLARDHRHLQCRISTPPQSMGAFWAVARGSETPPRLIHLIYRGPKNTKQTRKRLGVVGKGLLFDTGGYSIKTSTGMETMKMDCGGAAACLGAAAILAALAPPNVEVHFVVAACENMVNERAMVPGDILQASNGKTIEVLNTDAEGRLTLADALVFADKKLKCEEIVELSTLTGSCMAALGPSYAGLFTQNEELCHDLLESSRSTGELLWRLPVAKEEYGDWIKSNIADLRNMGTSRLAGATTAALFLQEFVSDSKPFAHLDIAGTALNEKQATGFGARLIASWVGQKTRSA